MNTPIWVDMDGVLCDFNQQYARYTGRTWVRGYENEIKDKDKWDQIAQHPHFFADLPWLEGAKELWAALHYHRPNVLSASSKHMIHSKSDKLEWCKRELGISEERIVIVGRKREKKQYCSPGDILIDDHPDNRREWQEAGGIAIWEGDPISTLNKLKENKWIYPFSSITN